MFCVGEARPYVIMASTAVELLVFFSLDLKQRRSWIGILIGLYAIDFRAFSHPYWVFFLSLALTFGLYLRCLRLSSRRSFRSALNESSPAWIGVGLLVAAVTAIASWAKGSTGFQGDPWKYVESPLGAVRTLGSTHFGLLGLPSEWAIPNLPNALKMFNIDRICIVIVVMTSIGYLVRDRVANIDLAPALVLLGLGVFSTVAISLLSLFRNYWIVQGQWLGEMAFATIAIVWLIALLVKRLEKSKLNFGALVSVVAAVTILWNSYVGVSNQIVAVRNHIVAFLEYRQETRSEIELIEFARETGAWEYVANVNAVRGGPVWRGLALCYGIS